MPITVELIEARGSHLYKVTTPLETLTFPGVTTITSQLEKPALYAWYNKMGREAMLEHLGPYRGRYLPKTVFDRAMEEAKTRPTKVRDEAADYGTEAHDLIRRIILGESPAIPDSQTQTIASFEKWHMETGISDFDLAEHRVASLTYEYGGTLDAKAYRDKTPLWLDWKSGNALYEEAAWQLSAYVLADIEMGVRDKSKHYGILSSKNRELTWGLLLNTEAWVVRLGKARPDFEAKRVSCYESFLVFKALRELAEVRKETFWEET